MSRLKPQWQLQALAAQRRDTELRRAEELKKVASYFEHSTNKSKHHEQWTTEDYYERANKEAELLSKKKIKEMQLEERRKKLETMLFQEQLQYQEEMKNLTARPKYFKNGSYLNKVPTSTLQDINQGIRDKEEQLRRQEAELRLHHAWRLRQPEIRATESFVVNGKLKSAWMEQIVEKEMQKKKEEEETRRVLQERDEELHKQIVIEKEKMKKKDEQMKELRNCLQSQIAELSEKETVVKQLRTQEERERIILNELKLITDEREREHNRLMAEKDANIVNMGLHKLKLKKKVLHVMKEIELDLIMLEKIRKAVIKDYETEQEKSAQYKLLLDSALEQLQEYREEERVRKRTIEAMYDGEARQINEKQDRLWERERQARAMLMDQVLTSLKQQLEERIEENRQRQKENVVEREEILNQMESFHQEVRASEQEKQLKTKSYSAISALQSQLNGLKMSQQRLEEAAEREAGVRAAVERERRLRQEIARTHRAGTINAWI